MSDNGNPPDGSQSLSPQYKPAEMDSALLVTFVGNTAVIGSAQFKAVDAFQLLAVGDYLQMKGRQIISGQEAQIAESLARNRIMTPSGAAPIDADALRAGPRSG